MNRGGSGSVGGGVYMDIARELEKVNKDRHSEDFGAGLEDLATEQGWPVPTWSQDPACFLPTLNLGVPDYVRRGLTREAQAALLDVLTPDCPPTFRRHGIVVKWNLMQPRG